MFLQRILRHSAATTIGGVIALRQRLIKRAITKR
jgi:hypothetical protein